MRSTIYEVLAVGLLLGSGFFFVRCIHFLAGANYVAGLATMVIGFAVLRTGVEFTKLSVLARREEQ